MDVSESQILFLDEMNSFHQEDIACRRCHLWYFQDEKYHKYVSYELHIKMFRETFLLNLKSHLKF